MDKSKAKKEACWWAATVLQTARQAQTEGIKSAFTTQDAYRFHEGLRVIITNLIRRGGPRPW